MEQRFEDSKDVLKNANIGIYYVDENRKIIWANSHELELLGYTEDEYVGHHVSEFLVDPDVLQDMLAHLDHFENWKNYPVRVKGKNGIVYVMYNSSVYSRDGKFVHTRCFSSDVSQKVYELMKAHSPYYK